LIFIELNLPTDVRISKIEVLNNLGQKIMEINLQWQSKGLIINDLNMFSGGVYWVQIFDEKGMSLIEKLIKN